MKSYLRANGVDPEKDIQMVAVGLGAPPVDALRTNKVQALLFWASAQATFENAGLKLRYLIGPDWRTYPDFTLSTLKKTFTGSGSDAPLARLMVLMYALSSAVVA